MTAVERPGLRVARFALALLGTLALAVGGAASAQHGPGGGGGGGGGWRGGGGPPMRGSGEPMRDGGRDGARDGGWRDAPAGVPRDAGPMARGYYERRPGYVVRPRYYVAPPIGFTVAVLPPYYTTLWLGGFPYFYADGAYYMWRERERHYEVVEAPAGAETSRAPASTPDDLFVYPKQGQSEDVQSKDRYECHRWAVDQTTYDPTQPAAGLSRDDARAKRDDYRRAMTACLESRGYTVR
jgi:hypothetical protein